MQHRRALIVDRDKGFAEQARRCFRLVGIPSDVLAAPNEALDHIESRPPAIILVAVEQPKRRGFALFSDIRRKHKQVPIVLTTSTVPMNEMLTHQKLRLHGDAYLDKRELSDLELLETLNRLLPLNLDPAEMETLAAKTSRGSAGSQQDEGDDEELLALGFDLDALLEETQIDPEDDLEPVEHFHDADDSPVADVFDEEGPTAREVAVLRHQLEVARRAATSSPFSSEYLKLSDRAERLQRDLGHLRAKLETYSRRSEALRSKLIDTAGRLVESERARDHWTERARELEAELDSSKQELNRGFAEERRRGEQQRLEYVAALAKQKNELAREAEQALAARDAEWESRIDELRREHRLAMEAVRQERDARLQEQQRKFEDALARKDQELEERLERTRSQTVADLRAAHATECERLRSEHAKRIEDMIARQEQAFAASGDEWHKKLDQIRETYETGLTVHREERDREIARLVAEHEESRRLWEQERDAAVDRAVTETRREQLRDGDLLLTKLEQAEQGHRSRVAELQGEHRGEVERLRRSHESEVERLKDSHEREIVRLKSHHEGEIQRLRADHNASLEELAGKLRVAQQEAIDARQAEWDAQLQNLPRAPAGSIAPEREQDDGFEDLLEPASSASGADQGDRIEDAETGEVDSPHDRLRRLAAELDRVGKRSLGDPTAAAADEVGKQGDRPEARR